MRVCWGGTTGGREGRCEVEAYTHARVEDLDEEEVDDAEEECNGHDHIVGQADGQDQEEGRVRPPVVHGGLVQEGGAPLPVRGAVVVHEPVCGG